ncbi:tryptophan--tRNA ligase [Anaplasmataceae bacterium AB001_6]|nr:tryptophan--tRNA ligase [Anaplasmataceae bacterium AB001_6]
MKTTMFSGIQPTGSLHIGNYFGAIANWVDLQNDYDQSIFCIVDLHACTNLQSFDSLKQDTLSSYIYCLASGLDPKKSIIFVQSSVSFHTELQWILSCMTPISWLNRMTQFKDKSSAKNKICTGLMTYPLLMASDILLYDATHVAVGIDQKQHLELTCDLVRSFNTIFKSDIFTEPQYIGSRYLEKIMSLKNGNAKMSKSDSSERSRINLSDDPDVIRKKIMSAKTDSLNHLEINSLNERPEMLNLVNIYSILSGFNIEKICDLYVSNQEFKHQIAEMLVAKLIPIQDEVQKIRSDLDYVYNQISIANDKAADIAERKMKKIKDIINIF